MLFQLVRRELRSRFVGSVAGWLWLIVNPLLLLAVYTVVFGMIFQARAPESLGVPFIVFLAIALWPWLGFSDAILRASESIPDHAALISKVPLKRELLALSHAIASFVLQLAGYAAVLTVTALAGYPISPAGLPAAVLALAALLILAGGLGLIAATLRVFFRDFQQLLPTLLMLWFFLTPILYAPGFLPERLRVLVHANPIAGLMGDLRAALLEGQAVPGASTWTMLLAGSVLFALALWFFRRMAPYFEDFL